MKRIFRLAGLLALWPALASAAPAEKTYTDAEAKIILEYSGRHLADLQGFFEDRHRPGTNWKKSEIDRFLAEAKPGTSLLTPPEPPKPKGKPKLWGIKIRQDYSDVVAEEDPSITDPKKRNALKGATFSYTRDFVADGDAWSVQGALIRPFTLHRIDRNIKGYSFEEPFSWESAYLIPSVSLNKSTSDFDPKAEVDSLVYRLGASSAWNYAGRNVISEYEFRAFATYGTDTGHDSSITAGEFDFEPRIYGTRDFARLALGVPASLSGTEPDAEGNNSNFIYQTRAYLHGEFGEVRDTGGNPDLQAGSFFRMGPVTSLEMYPCFLARAMGRDPLDLVINVGYTYLPTVSGSDFGSEYYFTAGLGLTLMKGKGDYDYQKIALRILYQRGGLELTKEEVETLTVGFGITF